MILRIRITKSYLTGLLLAALFLAVAIPEACAQTGYTWDQVKAKFEATNPALKADNDNVDEARAEEITANLRPNPQFGTTADGTQIVPNKGAWQPLKGTFVVPGISYLHERERCKAEFNLISVKDYFGCIWDPMAHPNRLGAESYRQTLFEVIKSAWKVD